MKEEILLGDEEARAALYRRDHEQGAAKRTKDKFYGPSGNKDEADKVREDWLPMDPAADTGWDDPTETVDDMPGGRQVP